MSVKTLSTQPELMYSTQLDAYETIWNQKQMKVRLFLKKRCRLSCCKLYAVSAVSIRSVFALLWAPLKAFTQTHWDKMFLHWVKAKTMSDVLKAKLAPETKWPNWGKRGTTTCLLALGRKNQILKRNLLFAWLISQVQPCTTQQALILNLCQFSALENIPWVLQVCVGVSKAFPVMIKIITITTITTCTLENGMCIMSVKWLI